MTGRPTHGVGSDPLGRGALPRRGVLTRASLLLTASAAAAACDRNTPQTAAATAEPAPAVVPFHGEHQAGVLTQPTRLLTMLGLDLRNSGSTAAAADALRRLLRLWTDTGRRLTAGDPALADLSLELGADPAHLTVTVGLGAGAFRATGLTRRAPSWLKPLPSFAIDSLQDRWSGGDIMVQICSDAELPLSHAVRLLTTDASPFATVRWMQRGFRSASEGTQNRNLFGQVDGTINPLPEEADKLVWISEGLSWLRGGTSMVVRRIAMDLVTWEKVDREGREASIGRTLVDGSPVTGGPPHAPVDLTRQDPATGLPMVLPAAHVRRAVTGQAHQRVLRRPYNYDEPSDTAHPAGLVFITFQADPVAQFLPIQRRLAQLDLLNQWTTPIGSAVFAVLPGCRDETTFLGQALFS